MYLPKSQVQSPQLHWLDQADSTNLELIRTSQLPGGSELPHFTVVATANQVAGRGRAGRSWQAPADSALAISVLLRPQTTPSDLAQLSWVPLLAGLAMSQTVKQFLPLGEVGIKWPNDVQVGANKISGTLSELLPGLNGVVIGAGINLTQSREQLPTETSTSLALEGANLPTQKDILFDNVLSAYLSHLRHWFGRFVSGEFNAVASGLRQAVADDCLTLGRQVRAILPGEQELVGHAVGIDESGRLVLEVDGIATAISAADIVHLRH
ncbi:MAG: biotin--[acetyl-CoA-carboxylase] ligase [Micrococcales bacterium]